MKIIIAGAGRVGGSIAEALCAEEHDVTVIDRDAQTIAHMSNDIDAICIEGSATDPDALTEAGAKDADMLLAVTEQDEVNMVCAISARSLGTRNIVARVRDPQYLGKEHFLSDTLGISMIINPEYEFAREIARIIRLPGAARVDTFSKGSVEIAEHRVSSQSVLEGVALKDLRRKFGAKVLVSLAEREGEAIIPNGEFVISDGDSLSITGTPEELRRFFSAIGAYSKPVKTAMLIGGGRISVYLTRLLIESGISVTVVENDPARCEMLTDLIPQAGIVNGDATKSEVLLEEGIKEADAFAALTEDDGDNIITSIYAGHCGVEKVVTRVNHEHFAEVVDSSGLDCVLTPKDIVVDRITRYVRAVSDSGENEVETLYRIAGGRAEALELEAREGDRCLGVPLRELKLNKNVLIANIVRGRKSIIPEGSTVIEAGDRLVVVSTAGSIRSAANLLED